MPELIDIVMSYGKEDIYPFHMPGHKRNRSFIPNDLLSLDITEIYGSDNLHEPRTVIKAAQEYAARLWKSDKSFFLVNGSSCGVAAAVMSACKEGEAILAARNSHISFYSGLALSGAQPVYITPRYLTCGLAGGIAPEDVERELKRNKAIKAVFITSPTYEGFVSNIELISKIAHSHGKILIVDEAHGAHFIFSNYFPESAIRLGADIVIQSLHKTLPALGQSAILHTKGCGVDLDELKLSLSIMQTTSPSYILMSVMQNMLYSLVEKEDAFYKYIEQLKAFRKAAECLKNIELIGWELCGESSIQGIDMGKLVFLIKKEGLTGGRADNILREKHKIQIEASGCRHFIALTSVADTQEGFNRLLEGVAEIDDSLTGNENIKKAALINILPEIALTPRDARNRKKIVVSLTNAIGKISAEHIATYPPGVPILAAGEIITEEIAENILSLGLRDKINIIMEDR